MSLNVLWRSSVGAQAVQDNLSLLSEDIELMYEQDREKALEHLNWLNVLIDGNPDEAMLDAANLKHVIVPYVGVNDKLRKHVLARPHLKLYNSHFNDAFVAQHAVALLLACANRIVEADRPMRQGDWRVRYKDTFLSVFLPGKTCLLAGYGAIGKEVAQRVRALGMQVSALRKHPSNESSIIEYGADQLHEALANADAIIISLPSTPETKGMFDKAAFDAMKTGSILVNVGRGNIIEQQALYNALTRGHLLAAGLDVWWRYPENEEERTDKLPADVPLHDLPNLIMSPHRANMVAGWEDESFRDVAKTLHAILKGETRNQVDPERGY